MSSSNETLAVHGTSVLMTFNDSSSVHTNKLNTYKNKTNCNIDYQSNFPLQMNFNLIFLLFTFNAANFSKFLEVIHSLYFL